MFSSCRAARVFTADEAPADSIITHPDIHQRVCGSGATPMQRSSMSEVIDSAYQNCRQLLKHPLIIGIISRLR
jgi:hypothetical protein